MTEGAARTTEATEALCVKSEGHRCSLDQFGPLDSEL